MDRRRKCGHLQGSTMPASRRGLRGVRLLSLRDTDSNHSKGLLNCLRVQDNVHASSHRAAAEGQATAMPNEVAEGRHEAN
jgi:hypothetical protein